MPFDFMFVFHAQLVRVRAYDRIDAPSTEEAFRSLAGHSLLERQMGILVDVRPADLALSGEELRSVGRLIGQLFRGRRIAVLVPGPAEAELFRIAGDEALVADGAVVVAFRDEARALEWLRE